MLRDGTGVPLYNLKWTPLWHSLFNLFNGLDIPRCILNLKPVKGDWRAHHALVHTSSSQLRELEPHRLRSSWVQVKLPELEHVRLHPGGHAEGMGSVLDVWRHEELGDDDGLELGDPVLLPVVLLGAD